jgi:hypothetical protein
MIVINFLIFSNRIVLVLQHAREDYASLSNSLEKSTENLSLSLGCDGTIYYKSKNGILPFLRSDEIILSEFISYYFFF